MKTEILKYEWFAHSFDGHKTYNDRNTLECLIITNGQQKAICVKRGYRYTLAVFEDQHRTHVFCDIDGINVYRILNNQKPKKVYGVVIPKQLSKQILDYGVQLKKFQEETKRKQTEIGNQWAEIVRSLQELNKKP